MNMDDWTSLPTDEQRSIAKSWSPYIENEDDELIGKIAESFRIDHPELDVRGLGNVFGSLMLCVDRPFIFNKRTAPKQYLGLSIRYSLSEGVPEGFEIYTDYVWAPENYLNFVFTSLDQIRSQLEKPRAEQDEILSDLVGMEFDDWIKQCREWGYTKMVPGQRELPE